MGPTGLWPNAKEKKHVTMLDPRALRAMNAISKGVLFGVGPVPTENSIMATHDRGLTTAVAIPSAKLISCMQHKTHIMIPRARIVHASSFVVHIESCICQIATIATVARNENLGG